MTLPRAKRPSTAPLSKAKRSDGNRRPQSGISSNKKTVASKYVTNAVFSNFHEGKNNREKAKHKNNEQNYYEDYVNKSMLEACEEVRFEKHGPVVLFLDSDYKNLEKLCRFMRSSGNYIHTAMSYRDAMRLLHEYPIDIIVTRQLFKGGTALNLLQFLHEKTANKAEVLMLEKHHPSRDEERNNANTNGIHKRADHCDSSVAV